MGGFGEADGWETGIKWWKCGDAENWVKVSYELSNNFII